MSTDYYQGYYQGMGINRSPTELEARRRNTKKVLELQKMGSLLYDQGFPDYYFHYMRDNMYLQDIIKHTEDNPKNLILLLC